MSGEPNLFDFATSELSQDAMLCWLISWAHKKYAERHSALHKAGQHFVRKLLEKAKVKVSEIDKVEVKQQQFKIDVLVLVNDDIAIIIEDKIACIYLKTGEQGDYSGVEGDGYSVFTRGDLLDVLREGIELGIKNHIYSDFLAYIQALDDEVNSWEAEPIKVKRECKCKDECKCGSKRKRKCKCRDKCKCGYKNGWSGMAWQGFFAMLQKELKTHRPLKFKYVANPSGGFQAAYWNFTDWDESESVVYMQLEERKLCFKLNVEKEETDERRKELRKEWWESLEKAAGSKFNIKKYDGRGNVGKITTCATIDSDDWTVMQKDKDILDKEKTIARLQEIQDIMGKAVPPSP